MMKSDGTEKRSPCCEGMHTVHLWPEVQGNKVGCVICVGGMVKHSSNDPSQPWASLNSSIWNSTISTSSCPSVFDYIVMQHEQLFDKDAMPDLHMF